MKRDAPDLTAVRRLLVIKMSALGDVAKAIPTVQAIRAAYPHLQMGWVVRPGNHHLLVGSPDVDHLILAPRSLKGLLDAVQSIRRFEPEVLLDMQGLFLSGIMSRLSGASWRCTWASGRELSGILTGNPIITSGASQNATDALFGFARAVGVADPTGTAPAYLADDPRLVSSCGEMLAGLPRPVVGMHVGASSAAKSWPEGRWRSLAHLLLADGLGVALFGGPREVETAGRVADGQGPSCRDLAGRTSPRELACAISKCSVFVGGDTGATHIAALVRTPTVCLMGPTDPALMGPSGDMHTSIHLGLPCSPCWRKPTCDGRFDCMSGIEPERVYHEVRARLAGAARGQG